MPRRRTFAAGILPFAHSMLTSLRRPGFARPATPAPRGTGSPSLSSCPLVGAGWQPAPGGVGADAPQVENLRSGGASR